VVVPAGAGADVDHLGNVLIDHAAGA
jgi:hypothetical protein